MTVLTINPVHTALKCRVQDYFKTLNAGDYYDTSLLFALSGRLIPPFEEGVQGQDAIAHYLSHEAIELICRPQTVEVLTDNRVVVQGLVQTPLFSVNAIWRFNFDADQLIQQLQVELVASLKELLTYRP
ncbi:MAG: nuclear transport factor 2 family protein [Cyanobacteria bacterium P01_G01_bin.54]